MGIVSVSCGLHCHISDVENNDFEITYNRTLRKIISFLYNHPKVSFTFYLPGPIWEWLEKNHAEFITLLTELVNRKQVEILGGGYYEPIFPLIMPIDRVGQIELNTTNIRKQVGKKPRGIFLGDTVWDPSLISSFKTCGMEFAILHNSLIPENEPEGKNLIVEDMGKTLTIIPFHQPILDFSELPDAQKILEKVKKLSESKNNELYLNDNHLYFTSFSLDEIAILLETGWLETFCNLVESSPLFDFSYPSLYLKNNSDCIRSFVPAGCPPEIQKWTAKPFEEVEQTHKNTNIKNFLHTYQEVQYLYSRMMYVSLIVSQSRGDKIRKKSAREFLWKAQSQDSYWFLGDAGIGCKETRGNAYKNLITSEKIVRETSKSLTDSALSFDYDMDGRKEYIIHQNDYNAFVSQCGGMIFELDLLSNTKNYCDTMCRISEFDGVTDSYPKRLFLDHLISFENFDNFTKDFSNTSAVFSQIVYTEHNFDRVRKELQLTATALLGVLQQPVTLKKKFLFTQNGIQVQYILKNDSPLPLKCYFAVESNLCLSGTSNEEQLIEIISADNKEQSCPDQIYIRQDGVSLVQFTDIPNKNVFVFQPNEDAGICIQPLYISRPVNQKTEKRYQATTSSFFWKVDIPPAYELEKTLFLGICPTKKSSNSKKRKKED